jgi:molybdopterin synthase catalytic subunit/molybdopterin converting factor small subunit
MDDVRVLVFGPLRERVGVAEVQLAGTTVQEVWDELVRRHPSAATTGSVRAARNLDYCEWTTAVRSGDTIAFIPPVAGGSSDEPAVRVWVTDKPIDVGSMIAGAGTSRDGAVATFVGRVRDHSDGVAVQRMDYEAYAEMAESEMRRIGIALFRRGGISTITIVHRTGSLLIGDASVAVVVAAPHRDTAFPACQEALEQIKRTVPVWKREHRADGAHWVDARHGDHEEEASRPQSA